MGVKHMTISGCPADTAFGFSLTTLHDGIGISLWTLAPKVMMTVNTMVGSDWKRKNFPFDCGCFWKLGGVSTPWLYYCILSISVLSNSHQESTYILFRFMVSILCLFAVKRGPLHKILGWKKLSMRSCFGFCSQLETQKWILSMLLSQDGEMLIPSSSGP